MKIIFALVGALLVSALAACSSIVPSTRESRHMPFPLPGCTDQMLARAREAYTQAKDVQYDAQWVCVTRTAAKVERDDADQKNKVERSSVAGNLDADSGPNPGAISGTEEARAAAERGEKQARSPEESKLRQAVEAPYVRDGAPRLGIALSGGGTKAGSFAVGVLSGLADLDLLDQASYISSVSGGSYAAYFYYTHKIFPITPGRHFAGDPPSSKDLFRDCVRLPSTRALVTTSIWDGIKRFGDCTHNQVTPSRTDEAASRKVMYQALLRCQQDVLNPGSCSVERTGEGITGISGSALLLNVLTAPASWFSTTIFDWGLVTSPSAVTYRDGIGMAYGTSPVNVQPLMALGTADRVVQLPTLRTNPDDRATFDNTDKKMPVVCANGAETPASRAFARDCFTDGVSNVHLDMMNFEELRQGLLSSKVAGKPLPFWIINSVATKSRSSLGWWTMAGKFNTSSSDVFEMTAVSHGSGRYGYVPTSMYFHGFTVLDAVATSAAFFDPNQNVLGGKYLRGPLGVLQRLGNFDWGKDISNYNVSDARRTFHTAMPFPVFDSLYSRHVLHRGQPEEDVERIGSVFIRLIDGGNGENLGAYSLLKRGVKNIVISDAAQDDAGAFSDICEARRRIELSGRRFYVPGLRNLAMHCNDLESGNERSYGVHDWRFKLPVLLGCVRDEVRAAEDGTQCDGLKEKENRLFIVKPAVDMTAFANQLQQVVEGNGAREKKFRQVTRCTMPNDTHTNAEPLNCESSIFLLENLNAARGRCQVFPQHSTVTNTANSSHLIFAAYRELGRQYVNQAGEMLKALAKGEDPTQAIKFEEAIKAQHEQKFADDDRTCEREAMLAASVLWPEVSE